MIARGAVFWVDLDPTIGRETRKTRPCVVVQRDAADLNSPTTIVCPLTDATPSDGNLLNVFVSGILLGRKNDSVVVCNQIRTVEKSRLSNQIGTLPTEIMSSVNRGLRAILDLTS